MTASPGDMAAGLAALRSAYPWPDVEGVPAYDVALDGGGRELIDALLFAFDIRLMLEVGCFLNGSVKRWLERHSDLCIVGVDTWDDAYLDTVDRHIRSPVMTPSYAKVGDRAAFVDALRRHGLYRSALAAVADHRDRFIPVQGASPDALHTLKAHGAEPGLIYIDADKKAEDLVVAHTLWPDAILCGDDWSWGADQGYPMQTIVNAFAAEHGMEAFAVRATWMLRKAAR